MTVKDIYAKYNELQKFGISKDSMAKIMEGKDIEYTESTITGLPCWIIGVKDGNLRMLASNGGSQICELTIKPSATPEGGTVLVQVMDGSLNSVSKELKAEMLPGLRVKGFPRFTDVDIKLMREACFGCVDELVRKQELMAEESRRRTEEHNRNRKWTISDGKDMGF